VLATVRIRAVVPARPSLRIPPSWPPSSSTLRMRPSRTAAASHLALTVPSRPEKEPRPATLRPRR
jgi:hypothetical protein